MEANEANKNGETRSRPEFCNLLKCKKKFSNLEFHFFNIYSNLRDES